MAQRKTYNKLIRDDIPEIIRQNGGDPSVSTLDDAAFKNPLTQKLIEEAEELAEAETREDIINELADVLQLVESIAENNDLTLQEIEQKKEDKKQSRGAFTRKLFLEHVDEP